MRLVDEAECAFQSCHSTPRSACNAIAIHEASVYASGVLLPFSGYRSTYLEAPDHWYPRFLVLLLKDMVLRETPQFTRTWLSVAVRESAGVLKRDQHRLLLPSDRARSATFRKSPGSRQHLHSITESLSEGSCCSSAREISTTAKISELEEQDI
jgi:hypothetical protein